MPPRPTHPPRRSALAALALAVALFFAGGEIASAAEVKVGSALPKLAFRTLDGKPFSFAEHKGQIVLVDFWATWCTPCHLQTRILEPIHRDYKDKGVKFFSVDLGESADTVRKFLAKHPLPYPTLLDPQDSAAERLQVYALPTLMVLDRSGRIAFLQNSLVDGLTLRRVLQKAGAPSATAR